MNNILIWTPESDFDSKTVCCIAQKIVKYYDSNINVLTSSKEAFNQAIRKQGGDGLKNAVDIYLKNSELVIFLLDADGVQSEAQRLQEPNSLINRIKKVVEQSQGKALLILIRQELEAWLLVDCLGICCYFTKNLGTRSDPKWEKFAKKYQKGETHLITESEPGGKNAKEYLIKFSKDIVKKINPKLKDRDLEKQQYYEHDSEKVADKLEINHQTIARNNSLSQFAQHFKKKVDSSE
ncbi:MULTISPECIES: hypothetical protein [unclassified Microcoleus]|uniref:hypothetical protein n=1 Tax=unclassified Microcoleus TaxID=2642155 RepID=UPI002FD02751